MKSLKGSETEKNLLKSFAGESQARNRYTYFAGVAKKEGYEQISGFFIETADNEKEHAKVFFKFLEGGDLAITAEYPAGKIDNTAENLSAAADGEKMEWGTLYPNFAAVAKKEGYDEVTKAFEEIAKVEAFHEKRYRSLLKNVKESSVFKKQNHIKWHCRNCGYIYYGSEAPQTCPACKHPQAHYEVLAENY